MKTTDYRDGRVVEKYLKKTLAGVYVNYPAILKLSSGVRGKTVLDLGCGAGWLAGQLSKNGNRVYAIDCSPKWINICKRQNEKFENITSIIADAGDLRIFKSGMFDRVVANMVFLSVSSEKKLKRIFKEAGRVLKKGGVLIFSDAHPVTNMVGSTGTKVSGRARGFSYFDNGKQHRRTYLLSDYSHIDFIDSHWNLEFYCELLNKNGMVIERILEPRPVRIDPRKKLKDYLIPEYIIFKCRKLWNK